MSTNHVYTKDIEIINSVLYEVSSDIDSASQLSEDLMLYEDLGIDSLQFIRLILEVEDKLGRKIFNADNIGNIVTVKDLYNQLQT